MPKLNKTIIRSIVQDLKSLEKICNELRKHAHNSETMSWRYPPQMCHCININNILSEYKGSAYECYLLVLELMYDRFQYFLHLIIKYLDMVPFIPHFESPQNVLRPEYLSTGALLNMLWIRFQTLQKYFLESLVGKTRNMDKSNVQNVTLSLGATLSQSISVSEPTFNQKPSFNRNVQTETCSFSKCESCYISEDIVKFIVKEVQIQCTECEIQSILLHKCDNIKQELFRTTQWGAMMNWSNEVQNDLKEILQLLTKQIKENKKLQESLELEKLRIEEISAKKDNEIHELKRNIQSLETFLMTEKSKTHNLEKEKEHLSSKLTIQEQEILQLQVDLKSSESSLNDISQHNSVLEAGLRNIALEFGVQISSAEMDKNILEYWKLFVSRNENEKKHLEKELQSLLTKLKECENIFQKELEKKEAVIREEKEKQYNLELELYKKNEYIGECQSIKQQNEQLQFNLKEVEQTKISLLNTIEHLKKELEQSRIQEKLLLENPDTITKIEVEVQGDPEQDMENQIQANEIRIQMLSQQTTKLKETLNKFRRLTKMHQNAFN